LVPAFSCFRPAQTQSQDGRGFSLVDEHAGFIVDATNSWEMGQPQMIPLSQWANIWAIAPNYNPLIENKLSLVPQCGADFMDWLGCPTALT
jgi:hypothetical protein